MMLIKSKPKKPIPTFRHGWNEYDQEEVLDLQIPHCIPDMASIDENLPLPSPNSDIASTHSSTPEEDDFAWDNSLLQQRPHSRLPLPYLHLSPEIDSQQLLNNLFKDSPLFAYLVHVK